MESDSLVYFSPKESKTVELQRVTYMYIYDIHNVNVIVRIRNCSLVVRSTVQSLNTHTEACTTVLCSISTAVSTVTYNVT